MSTSGTKSVPPRIAASPRAVVEPRAGTRLGRYELLLPLATGGMAQVWIARQLGDLGFSRLVAVKTIRPDLADDPSFRRMFLDEARVASRLHHANVVEVLDLGEDGATVYQAMSLVEGDSLTGLLRRWHRQGNAGGLPVSIVLRIVVDAAAGLHAAHTLTDEDGVSIGLVHRDVSPQNILVGLDGVAKIADFGIAKALGRLVDETEPGQIKGKYSYLSPEQVARSEVDRRADVFALGVVAWEALTGTRLFRGEDAVETIQKVLNDEIADPRKLAPQIPAIVAEITMRALRRDREKRFATAAEMGDAIEAAARHAGIAASTKEVAAFVKVLAGSDVEQRRATVREMTKSGASSPAWTPPPAVAPAEGSAPSTFATTDGDRRSRRAPIWAIAVGGLGALAIVAAAITIARSPSSTHDEPAAIPSAASPANVAPSAPTPAETTAPEPSASASPPPTPSAKTPPTVRRSPPPPAATPRPRFANPYGQ